MKKFPVCPSCHKSDMIDLTQIEEQFRTWSYGDRKKDEGYIEIGDITKVTAYCNRCQKSWTLRGIICVPAEWFEK